MSDYINQQIATRRARLAEIEGTWKDLDSERTALRAEIRAYEDVLAHSEERASTPRANGAHPENIPDASDGYYWNDLVARLGAEGAKFTTDDVARELKKLGKPIQRKSMRAKLYVLAKKKRIRRIKDGVYKLLAEPPQDLGQVA
ncbi:MAG TPA: hypothetical protein VHY79_07675 [Rhizomicrobium sp.]|jgi:hypothetical protein|nr:hypothetical protein [Rhizomicrobium sp.]